MGIIKSIIDKFVNKSMWTTIYHSQYSYLNSKKSINELLTLYKNWNYLCINLVANHILNIKTYLMKNNEEITDSPVLKILEKPNDLMYKEEFLEKIILWLELTGNAFIYKIRNGNNKIIELFPLRPDGIIFNFDNNNNIISYTYKMQGKELTINKNDLIHIKHASAEDYYWGKAPTEAILSLIEMDEEIRNQEKTYFHNGGIPSYLLISKARLSEAEFQRFKQLWNEEYLGTRNAYKPAFISGDIDVKAIGVTPKDQQFSLLSKWIKDSILHTYFIPSGIFESATTIATALQADVIFQREAILPRLKKIYNALTYGFAKEFDKDLYFDWDNPVPRDREFEMRRNIAYVQAGILTINEVREMEGYEKVDWGNEPYVPLSLQAKNKIDKKINNQFAQKWYEYIKSRRLYEIDLKQKIIEAFNEDGKKIKENIKIIFRNIKKDFDIDDLLIDIEVMKKYWKEFLMKIYMKIYDDFGKKEISKIGLHINWNIEKQNIKENIDMLLNKGIKEITGTTREKFKEILAEAIKEGKTYEQLVDLIDSTIKEWNTGKSRAWMIARTETTKITHAGRFMAGKEIMEEYKVKLHKVWISALDERTRGNKETDEFNHLDANGEEVDYNEPFIATGEALMFPGDPNGSPGNVINCRCDYETIILEKEEV